jgi:hypothetical protein
VAVLYLQASKASASLKIECCVQVLRRLWGTRGAAKRALYIAIRHTQVALDVRRPLFLVEPYSCWDLHTAVTMILCVQVVVEDDLEDGYYALIFLFAPHIRSAAADGLVNWVGKGERCLAQSEWVC